MTVVALSAGQVLFKIAAAEIDLSVTGFARSLLNVNLLAALLVYFVATIMWLLVLRVSPLRIAYPFAGFSFVVVPLMAHYLLDEAIGWNTIAGAILIGAGIWVSSFR
jgi:drug/metabolite transporter (DMT)-like permease